MQTPFDRQEYQARIVTLQRLMTDHGIDGLLFTTKGNVNYITGYDTHRWLQNTSPIYGILPRDGQPKLLVGGIELCRAIEHPWITDIRSFGGMERLGIAELVQLIGDLSLERAVIGIESGSIFHMRMAFADFQAVIDRLPGARFVDASQIFWKARSRKSAAEVASITRACDITGRALEELYRAVRPGMTEREVHSVMVQALMAHGADQQGSIPVASRSPGDRRSSDGALRPPTDRRIRSGDLVWLDAGCIVNGYWSDTMRMFCVGEAQPGWRDAYRFVWDAMQECIEEAVPGRPASAAMARYLARLSNSPFAEHAGDVGKGIVAHAIGLDLMEPPFMGCEDDRALEPGMVFTIEPFLRAPESGFFMLEEMVLVTESGPRILSHPAPREIMELG